MAIDYGLKRTGIAVTDPMRIIASPLTAVPTEEALTFLKEYMLTEKVGLFVIGEPAKLDGTPAEITPHINKFIEQLRKHFPAIDIDRIDERFTSKMAMQAMVDSGVKKKDRRKKGNIDKIAATIMLQEYMQQEGI